MMRSDCSVIGWARRESPAAAVAGALILGCTVYDGGQASADASSGGTVTGVAATGESPTTSGTESASAAAESTGDSGGGDFAEVGIRPPDVLALDGQAVSSGELRIISVEAAGSELDWTRVLDPAIDAPILKQATIGGGEYHPLFMVAGNTRVMRIAGEFDAAEPDLPAAHFDLVLVGAMSQPTELTIFLPSVTSQACTQVTGLGPTVVQDDNVDIFCAGGIADVAAVIEDAATGLLAVGQSPLVECTCGYSQFGGAPAFMMTPHGTVSSNGGCGFMCGDGSCVSASTACNGLMDCPSGEDEDPARCSVPESCCMATMGCPSESGETCGEMCCCCPSGQACCADPNDGCCAD